MSPLDDELRRALDARAEDLVPRADPMAGIEARARGIQRRRQALTSGGVAAAVLAVAVVVPLANRGDDRAPIVAATGTASPTVTTTEVPTGTPSPLPTGSPSATPTPTPTQATPTPAMSPTPKASPTAIASPTSAPTASTPQTPRATPSATPSGSVVPPPPTGGAKAIYYVGEANGAPRLYREFRRVPDASPAGILRTMMSAKPLDPDYSTLWPAGSSVTSATLSGDVLTVQLNDAALRGSAGSEFACRTLEQLVWTATAAERSASRVRVTGPDGSGVVAEWWGVGCGRDEPMARHTPSYEVLAPVQISSHNHGDQVSSSITLSGEATVFEATVSWSVIDKATGAVLDEGFATASAGAPARGTWKAAATLTGVRAGQQLELRAWESSANDGSVRSLETKTVRVAG
jgi:hypothetical protein